MDITAVEVLHDYVVRLRFADDTVKTIDLDPYLHGPVFAAIRSDPAVFAAVQVDHDAGTIVWPNGADLSPRRPLRRSPLRPNGIRSASQLTHPPVDVGLCNRPPTTHDVQGASGR